MCLIKLIFGFYFGPEKQKTEITVVKMRSYVFVNFSSVKVFNFGKNGLLMPKGHAIFCFVILVMKGE